MNTPLTTDLGILSAVGNTPLVRLRDSGSGAGVLVKLEYLNPSGSVKDRMALAIIEDAEQRGELKPGMTVVEYTGGSTGPALALACRAKGYELKLVTSSCFTPERLAMMSAFGADLEVLPRKSPDGMTQEDVAGMTDRVAELAALPDYFSTDQFHNQAMVEGYRRTLGQEILEQTDGRLAAFCTGVGTGGTLMGVALAIKEKVPSCQVVAMEPASSPALSQGVVGPHQLQGLSGGKSPLVDLSVIDSVETAGDEEAIATAAALVKTDGILAGITTGANVVVARRLAERLKPEDVVVTIAVDSGMKYMSTGIFG
ncbi:cysteine synthase A [Amycolatopsis sulphurea]|uniref:Cysteine synthase A n=1 Tax=Amycolatopsis sulphurea TaxID=76022 RepID=A0A2A9FJN8_9PSEU|nr:cysteine synthase family protein [Amycolatopsis sulphurea]PFG50645.1 cysteine synthase A [Amycolatopsis sulphurea]